MSKIVNSESAGDGKAASALNFSTPPPEINHWIDILHWCLMVLGPHHRDSGITANLLSFAYEHGGLSSKQSVIAERVSDWLLAEYRAQLDG